MKYKGVIFDMDGLMVDTEIIEHRAFEIILKEYGIEPNPYSNGLLHKPGAAGMNYYENFRNRHNIKDDAEVIKMKKRFNFRQIIEGEGIKPLPGFIDLLKTLKKENFKIALASNRVEDLVHLILDTLGTKDFFEKIIGPSKDRKHKPAPDIYVHTAKELKLKPGECVVLEDSEIGVISAKAAGMKTIAVPSMYTKDQDFSKADVVVKSLSDINMELLESL